MKLETIQKIKTKAIFSMLIFGAVFCTIIILLVWEVVGDGWYEGAPKLIITSGVLAFFSFLVVVAAKASENNHDEKI